MRIFDAHSHYMPPAVAEKTAFFKAGWSDLERQLKTMDDLGIERALLLYPTSDAHLNLGGWGPLCRIYNEAIAAVVRQYPDRFVGGGIVPGDDPEGIPEVLKGLANGPWQVLSLASSYEGLYLDDPRFFPIYDFAEKRGWPVHVHPQIIRPIGEDRVRDPLLTPVLEYVFDVSVCVGKLMMEGVLARFPKVKFIFAHYGGVLPIVRERFDNTYQMLRKRGFVKDIGKIPGEYFQNLYFDMSGSKSPAALAAALEMTDAGHILFGTDYPANQNIPQALEVVAQSPLTEGQKREVFCENFERVLSGGGDVC